MNRHTDPISARYVLNVSLRSLRRYAVVVFLFVTCWVAFIAQTHPEYRQVAEQIITEVSAPVVYAFSQPVDMYREVEKDVLHYVDVYRDNEILRQHVSSTQELQEIILALRSENHRLRELLNLLEEHKYSALTTHVIGNVSGPYQHSLLLHNQDNKIQYGQVAMANNVLLGTISDATIHTARVRLLTDVESKVPIMTERSNERAIAIGNNEKEMVLKYVRDHHKIELGERVLTSGDANFFQPGLAVGEVVRIEDSGMVYVKPLYDIDDIDYVHVMVKGD